MKTRPQSIQSVWRQFTSGGHLGSLPSLCLQRMKVLSMLSCLTLKKRCSSFLTGRGWVEEENTHRCVWLAWFPFARWPKCCWCRGWRRRRVRRLADDSQCAHSLRLPATRMETLWVCKHPGVQRHLSWHALLSRHHVIFCLPSPNTPKVAHRPCGAAPAPGAAVMNV